MIYLDYAATTPLDKEVKASYQDLLTNHFFNADSMYDAGLQVARYMEKSRELLGQMLQCNSEELIFTSCGSEANNLAIKGVAFQYANRGKHIITTSVEHSSVYEACRQLETVFGFEVDYLTVDKYGCVSLEDLKNKLREDTILVSIMCVNNEVGSFNDLKAIKKILQDYPKVIFHSDMVQALTKVAIDLNVVDLASFSAHKIHGLKGSGLLYKSKKIQLVSLISGGQQEFNIRGGTSDACTNIVFAKTLRLAMDDFKQKQSHVNFLNDYTRQKLADLQDVVINTKKECSSNAIINFSCIGYKPEVIMHALEANNIYLSTRSACSSKTESVSRVMKQLGLDEDVASSAMRISFGSETTMEQIDEFIYYLKESLIKTRKKR